ncbi:hypothetical protein RHSIM_Rhsim02G0131000 [Rhododendron simsii]|uniref:Uncharacterized protein n=1 Tax=Rhododendron simsii TaxID=118357 RepID=A0A834HCV8_RHOSS|nr:hypothetical protein RHSIM_Rhsim02G0131000 [Rhododendron simsii]
MVIRVGLFLLILALAMLSAGSSLSFDDPSFSSITRFDIDPTRSRSHIIGVGKVGDFIDEDEEGMVGTEFTRRVLAGQRYISYGALQANNVPCSKRGRSYYNCNKRGKANPYSRGCSYITREWDIEEGAMRKLKIPEENNNDDLESAITAPQSTINTTSKFQHYGYFTNNPKNPSDDFDDDISSRQSRRYLAIKQLEQPQCGVAHVINGSTSMNAGKGRTPPPP